jgi:hypothetical protein
VRNLMNTGLLLTKVSRLHCNCQELREQYW